MVALLLNYTVGISSLSLQLVYGSSMIVWILVQVHCLSEILEKIRSIRTLIYVNWSTLIATLSVIGILVFSLIRWSPYYNFHSADAGWHVFWARNIVNSQRLPDYSIVQPFNPPEVFTYGSHFLLASFSLFTGIQVENMYWFPLLLFYFLIFLAVFEFAKTLTGSCWGGLLASGFYSISQIPAGRILLGNLPDIIGYFLMILTLLITSKILTFKRLSVVFGLVVPSVISFYQYATVSIALTLSAALVLVLILHKNTFHSLLVMIREKTVQIGAFLLAATSLVFSYHTTYMNSTSLDILGSTNWSAHVPSISSYPAILGQVYLVAGLLGLGVLIANKSRSGVLVLSWLVALLAATHAPMLGIGLEPIRFLWHLIEPLSVTSGIFVFLVIDRLTSDRERNIRFWQINFHISHSSERSRLVAKSIVIVAALPVFIGLFAPIPFYPTRPSESYLMDDSEVGVWLASQLLRDKVVAIDADTDTTATWVQAYSQIPLFLYKADYAIDVASVPYRYYYENASYLFGNPFSPEVMEIAKTYNLSYVISHGSAVEAFSQSPFFESVHAASSLQVFEPRVTSTYGITTSAQGYYVNMTSGRKAFVLAEIEITFQAYDRANLTIPVYGQVAIPALPSTVFTVTVDGQYCAEFTVLGSAIVDDSPGLANLFNLEKIGVGESITTGISLSPGYHTIRIAKKSDVGFVIYAEDLRNQFVATNPSLTSAVSDG